MARRVITRVTDDLNGEDGAEELSFSLDGVDYTIDVTKANRDYLEERLAPFIAAARKVPTFGPRTAPRPAATPAVDREQLRAMRVWWVENWEPAGLPEPSDWVRGGRGRVPDAVMKAYQQHDGTRVRRPVPPAKFASPQGV